MLVKVNAKVSHAFPKSLHGMTAALWDADGGKDDFLAVSPVDAEGNAEFLFHLDQIRGLDSPLECFPDLYIIVKSTEGDVLFESEVIQNVNFFKRLELSGQDQTTLDIRFNPKLG
jgi:hypothetical protein